LDLEGQQVFLTSYKNNKYKRDHSSFYLRLENDPYVSEWKFNTNDDNNNQALTDYEGKDVKIDLTKWYKLRLKNGLFINWWLTAKRE